MTIWVTKKIYDDKIFYQAYYPTLLIFWIIFYGMIITNKQNIVIVGIMIIAGALAPVWIWVMVCKIFEVACGRKINLSGD